MALYALLTVGYAITLASSSVDIAQYTHTHTHTQHTQGRLGLYRGTHGGCALRFHERAVFFFFFFFFISFGVVSRFEDGVDMYEEEE